MSSSTDLRPHDQPGHPPDWSEYVNDRASSQVSYEEWRTGADVLTLTRCPNVRMQGYDEHQAFINMQTLAFRCARCTGGEWVGVEEAPLTGLDGDVLEEVLSLLDQRDRVEPWRTAQEQQEATGLMAGLSFRDLDLPPGIDSEVARQTYSRRVTELAFGRAMASASFSVPDEDYHTLTDFLAAPRESPNPVVEGLLFEGSNATLAAQFKAGKTTWALNLVKSYADNEHFLRTYLVHPLDGRIAWWNYELDTSDAHEWLSDLRIKNTDAVSVYNLRGTSMKLASPRVQEHAIGWLSDRDVKVWIIDPLFRAYEDEENSNLKALEFTNAIDYIKEQAGVSVVLLPGHTGRAAEGQDVKEHKERMRGPTRFDDWPDERFVMVKSGSNRYFKVGDSRHAIPHDERLLDFDAATRRLWVAGGTRREEQLEQNIVTMLGVLMEGPIQSAGDVRKVPGMIGGNANERADDAIRACEARGLVAVDRESRSNVYMITDAGKRWLDPSKLKLSGNG